MIPFVIQMASLGFHAKEKNCERIETERTLIMIDDLVPNDLLDNTLYYISGFIVKSVLPMLGCSKCKETLLLDPTDPTEFKMIRFPVYPKLTQSLQRGGLTFHCQQ